VTKAQLAILPDNDGRRALRRMVNLSAHLADPGASISDIELMNLSSDGFMAQGEFNLEPGATAWLKLEGLEPQNCRVVWAEESKAGFEFTTPLHPATVELVITASRKPVPKGHFGPQAGAGR
jgi:hypothetical protein